MNKQVVLDTETTGLTTALGHRIIEIGCLEMIDRKLTGKQFHCYLNPQRELDLGAVQVHGLTNSFLADKPLFANIVDELVAFINGSELIIHNAPFDIGFLNYELELLKKPYSPIANMATIIDTLVVARHKHPGQPNSLDALCRRYQVDNSDRNLHGALLDANLLAKVYLLMTGGQGQLFTDDEQDLQLVTHNNKIISHKRLDRIRYPLVMPTAAELAAHQAIVDMIIKQSGRCLFVNLGEEIQ